MRMVRRLSRSSLQGNYAPEMDGLHEALGLRGSSMGLQLWARKETRWTDLRYRYEKEFDAVQDVFELQRNLNNAFAYDLVPSPSVCTAALRAARRVNDFPTAVRIFEGTPIINRVV